MRGRVGGTPFWVLLACAVVASSSLGLVVLHPAPTPTALPLERPSSPDAAPAENSAAHSRTSQGPGSIVSTIDLLNNTVISGNYATANGLDPRQAVVDPASGQVLVFDTGNPNVLDTVYAVSELSSSTGALVGWLSLPANIYDAVYDTRNGDLYGGLMYYPSAVEAFNGSTGAQLDRIGVGDGAEALAYDSSNGDIFVANYDSGNLTVINGATNLITAWITVGSDPDDILYDPANQLLYVTNYGSGTVSVVNGTTDTLVATISGLTRPTWEAYDLTNGVLYVSGYLVSDVEEVQTSDDAIVGTIPSDGCAGIAYDPANRLVYVASSDTDNLTVVNGTTEKSVASIAVGIDPDGVTYDPENGEIYVANADSSNVSVIDPTTEAVVASTAVGVSPYDVGVDPDPGQLFVSNPGSDNTTIVNTTTQSVTGWRTTALDSWGVTVDPASQKVFVANRNPDPYTGNWSVINATTDRNAGGVGLGVDPQNSLYDPSNGRVYLVNGGFANVDSNISVINGATDASIASITVGIEPESIALDPVSSDLYLPNAASGNLSVVNATTDTATGSIALHDNPWAAAYDPKDGDIWVSHLAYPNITLVDPSTGQVLSNFSYGDYWVVQELYDPMNGLMYMLDRAGAIWVLNATTTAAVGEIFIGYDDYGMALDPQNGLIYIANQGQGSISVLSPFVNLPQLSQVSVSPTSEEMTPGTEVDFQASAVCSGGTCPSGTTYTWTLTNDLGTLREDVGPTVWFTAGSKEGNDTLFVNGTLNGVTVQSLPILINITATPTPVLSTVDISPDVGDVATGGDEVFEGYLYCTIGTCPAGATYAWSLSNGLGSLNSLNAQSVVFTAGPSVGNDTLFLNATLDGKTVASEPVSITIEVVYVPPLASVEISPTTTTLEAGESTTFDALIECTGGSCPAGTVYSWSLSRALGYLTDAADPQVTFTAGSQAGEAALFVNASLNGKTVQGGPAMIEVLGAPALSSVAITPAGGSVVAGATLTLSSVASCGSEACEGTFSYAWSLNNSLGTLSPASASYVTFLAGSQPGVANLTLTVTQGSSSGSAWVTVHVLPGKSTSPPPAGGISALEVAAIAGGGVAVVFALVAVVLVMSRRRRRRGGGPASRAPAPPLTPLNFPPSYSPPPVGPSPPGS